MQLAIHQPEFMPWLGFFQKMALADAYVVLDHVQFKKRYFENRNRVVSPKGEVSYIGLPVKTKGRFTQNINEVEIDNSQAWKKRLLKSIKYNYARTPYFDYYYQDLQSLVEGTEYEKLIDFNLAMISFFRRHLGISTPLQFSSSLDVSSVKGSDLILKICLLSDADVYLCGVSGRDYLDVSDFESAGVQIEWLDYKSPRYPQLCPDFAEYMSTIDLLFNHGPQSFDILMGGNQSSELTSACIS